MQVGDPFHEKIPQFFHAIYNGYNTFLCFSGFVPQVAKLGTEGVPACRVFSLEELREATNNFDRSTFMGDGSKEKVTSKTDTTV